MAEKPKLKRLLRTVPLSAAQAMPKPQIDELGRAILRVDYLGYQCVIELQGLFGDEPAIRFGILDETGHQLYLLCLDGRTVAWKAWHKWRLKGVFDKRAPETAFADMPYKEFRGLLRGLVKAYERKQKQEQFQLSRVAPVALPERLRAGLRHRTEKVRARRQDATCLSMERDGEVRLVREKDQAYFESLGWKPSALSPTTDDPLSR